MQELVEIDIENFNEKGEGVGYLTHPSKIKIYVPHALIGDKVEALLYRKKRRGYFKARISKILKGSSLRTCPSCSHTEICGGCSWQEIFYDKQLELKQKRVQTEFGYHKDLEQILRPIIASGASFHYRNKMEFSFSENGAKTKFLGLMIAAANKYVFNVEKCFLASEWVSKALNAVRNWWASSSLQAYNYNKDEGTLRYITFREGKRTSEKLAILTISGKEEYLLTSHEIDSFVSALTSLQLSDLSIVLRMQKIEKGKPTEFLERTLYNRSFIFEKMRILDKELLFKISPSSFFQPNTFQAEKLYSLALSLANVTSESVVLDLYCGTGTIGLVFSFFVKKVIGIEVNSQSVLDAKENIALNGVTNFEVISGDVGKTLDLLSLPKIDLVILDPPRAGLDELSIIQLKKLSPKKILYISCNPKTQSLNVKEFLSNYNLKIIQPLDQFPHTVHIENIVLLEEKS